jgi:hypothetical protein
MLNKLLDQFIVTSGDWNAQLFRELKSRFNIALWNGIVSQDVSWAIVIGIGVCSLVVYSLWGLLAYSYNNPISESED